MKAFAERGVEQMVYGGVLIRRKLFGSPAANRPPDGGTPVRVRGAAVGARLGTDHRRSRSGDVPFCEFHPMSRFVVRHRVQDGELHATEYTLVASSPFRDEVPCSHWLALLISEFDGRRTGLEVFEQNAAVRHCRSTTVRSRRSTAHRDGRPQTAVRRPGQGLTGSNNPKENIAVADAIATYCLPSTA